MTIAGSLRSTGSGPADLAVIYEVEERIEAEADGPGVLVSHTARPYLDDFAIVASFGLGVVVSRDPGTVRSLTDARPTYGHHDAPATFVKRFFDPTVYLSNDDVADFEAVVGELLALERRSFLGVMQAMRTFVAGLHRLSDNLGQAYTMMVSAVESLAQDFDGFMPRWEDLDPARSGPIDEAVRGLDPTVIEGVRRAILLKEHVSLARRYRAFTISHLGEDFLREETGNEHQIARYELEPAVKKAYELRSAYVHQLRSLPTPISHPHAHWETTAVERVPALTFQGLHRVTRRVIRSFVERQPKTEQEEYDYGLERAGIIQMEMAPQYWIWRPISDPLKARRRLEGLLSIVGTVLMREPDAALPDIRNALVDVERLLPQAAREHRPAILSLHFLFNLLLAPNLRSDGFEAFFKKYREEAGQPSVDSIPVVTILGAADDWPAEVYANALEDYFRLRVRRKGLHAPRLIEAAMCLTLAEKYRFQGKVEEARTQLVRAFEIKPGDARLRDLASETNLSDKIDWRRTLLDEPDGQNEPTTDNPVVGETS